MIDVSSEDLLDLRQACREPVFRNRLNGKPLHLSGMYRAIKGGARAANGERITLETIRTPRGLLTSREAIQRFVERLPQPDAKPVATASRARQRQIDAATRELENAGFVVGGAGL
jgi:hypothetical protein